MVEGLLNLQDWLGISGSRDGLVELRARGREVHQLRVGIMNCVALSIIY